MSGILEEVWGVQDPDGCQLLTLTDYLSEHGLLATGLPDDLDDAPAREIVDALSGRDKARIRILSFLSYNPSGTNVPHITAYTCKGVRTSRVDIAWSDDPDYRFVRRFLDDLETLDLVDLDASTRPTGVAPTTALIDLISKGKREMQAVDTALVYDRDFLRNVLATTNDLSDGQKHQIGLGLHRYVDRVNDYRLLFELTASDGFRHESETWTKRYKTRFNDAGRSGRSWKRLQGALNYGFEHADNAVLCTLTPDPEGNAHPDNDWRSILDIASDPAQGMNPCYHRLTQWMKTDPDSAPDTRRADVPGWAPERDTSRYHYFTGSPVPADGSADPCGPVTGRPRKRLEYVKVLEWTERGLPHLHVLFFNVPTREKDGMPWLVDKNELSHQWAKYGMGKIVDTYPLTYRDDLDELDESFGEQTVRDDDGNAVKNEDGSLKKEPVDEGFVCWYRYGDHDLGPGEVESRTRYEPHKGDRIKMNSTAGAYIGKYLSAMYEELFKECDTLDDREMHGKASWWKLGLYWLTNTQIWSVSEGIRDHLDDGSLGREHVRRGVVDATSTSISIAVEDATHWLDDLDGPARTYLHNLTKRIINDRDRDDADQDSPGDVIGIRVNHIGTYHYADLPKADADALGRDLDHVMNRVHHPDDPVTLLRADNPPPVEDVWG